MSESAGYLVKEIFGPTIQGEGIHAGKPCVFLRFARCNLACTWCDTDFAAEGARRLQAIDIVRELEDVDTHKSRLVIVTGGEPSLQWDAELASALSLKGFVAHMETNGTSPLAAPIDWITVSPKPQFHNAKQSLRVAPEFIPNECKVVVDDSVDDSVLDEYEARYSCEHMLLQPCMDDRYDAHLKRSVELVTRRPRWRLSLQLHKIIDVP